MRRRNPILSWVMAGVMFFTLSACGQQTQTSDQSQKESTALDQETETNRIAML